MASANGYRLSGWWRRSFSQMSLFYKFFYGTILIVLSVLLLSSAASYLYTRGIFEKQAAAGAARLVDNINQGFEDNLDQVDRIIMSMYSDAENNNSETSLREVLSPEPFRSLPEQYAANLAMQSFFQRLLNLRSDFNSVYIYVAPDKQFSYSVYGRAKWPYDPTGEDWYRSTEAAAGRTVISAPHLPFQLSYDKKVISFSRVLKGFSSNGNENDGVILIDLSMDALTNIVKKAKLGETTGVVLLNESGRTIYSSDSELDELPPSLISRMSGSPNGSFSAVIAGKRYLLSYSTLTVTGWKSATLTPYTEINQAGNRLLSVYLLLGLAGLALTVFISFLFSKKIFRPIQHLKKGIVQVKQGNFDVQLEQRSQDELGQLVFSFNVMVDTIRKLIVENYEEQLARKNAEFKYLQSQINPHFIFNTLQIVSGMAAVHKVPDIGTVSKSLAKMLRYSINMQTSTVPIRDEIENVICYMDIQKLRFRGFFDYDLDIDEEAYRYTIVKLILQPIVENSVTYGLEGKEQGGRVRISGRLDDGHLRFEVYDNGVGMTPEETKSLMASIVSSEAGPDRPPADGRSAGSGHSVGLRNIHHRIQMIYGPEYGLAIDSAKNEWTRVVIRIPAQEGGETA
ncbi:cache domain-containing sensor histidine kinase [Cohnella zeiphila]|uniref:Sensor histidine kinase n=1 Tax=Cohnella zeiphila TaxID=2761120 RepID=A0A7X0VXC9_9BACL|nr:sensor histidine kinase [Cohnella zeiphila]MBB6733312.1 sensor histidine kinase [Cohnella zeiphila]